MVTNGRERTRFHAVKILHSSSSLLCALAGNKKNSHLNCFIYNLVTALRSNKMHGVMLKDRTKITVITCTRATMVDLLTFNPEKSPVDKLRC